MIDALIAGVCAVGYVWAFRAAYRVVAESDPVRNTSDAVMTTMIAMCGGFLFPLIVPGWMLYRFARPVTDQERREAIRERERAVLYREEQVRRLEWDLGIGDRS